MKRFVLLLLLLTGDLCGGAFARDVGAPAVDEGDRSISGIIYFTNNSPKDKVFLAELFTADSKKRRVAVQWTGKRGDFEFVGLKPGRYILQVTIHKKLCLLQYVVDVRKQPENLRVFGDADCGHSHVAGVPAPRPMPRNKER